jgi:hypothetical protein
VFFLGCALALFNEIRLFIKKKNLLQMEILGVSLPWKGVFTNEGHGKRLIELAKNSQKEINPILSSSDSNPFLGTSTNENVPPLVQQSASANLWVDLLTGEDTFSEPILQPERGNAVNEGSGVLDFLDQAVVEFRGAQDDHIHSSSQDLRPSDSSSQQYLTCLTSIAGPSVVRCYLLHVALSHCIIPCLRPIIEFNISLATFPQKYIICLIAKFHAFIS